MTKEQIAKTYLSKAQSIQADMRILRGDIQGLSTLVPKHILELVPRGWVNPTTPLIEEYETTLRVREGELAKIQATINKLEYPLNDLLTMRYISGEKWETIAQVLFFSREYCKSDLLKKALRCLYEYIPKQRSEE